MRSSEGPRRRKHAGTADSQVWFAFVFAVAPEVYASGTPLETAMGHRMSFIIVADGPWVKVRNLGTRRTDMVEEILFHKDLPHPTRPVVYAATDIPCASVASQVVSQPRWCHSPGGVASRVVFIADMH